MSKSVLVAGVGNIFFGDDGFGVEVARRLAQLEMPDGVAVGDYGIRGMHLAYDLADGVETAILVDAMPRGGEPGTVYVVEPGRPEPGRPEPGRPEPGRPEPGRPEPGRPEAGRPEPGRSAPAHPVAAVFDAHGMQPDVVLGMLDTLGAQVGRVLIVGCEPASADCGMGLSEPVAAAVDDAVRVVLDLIAAEAGD